MKLPKTEVLKKLQVSLRLLGRDRNTVTSYCRTAGHFYDYVRAQPAGRTSEQLAEGYLTLRVTRDNVSAVTQNHHLRHWYATHFAGDLRDLQELLGHRSIETTALYRHPQLDSAVSPLAQLASQLALAA